MTAIRRKPIRTASGVTPVTVLTKPFPCPGLCIFCPSDIRMPKSYLSSEPGAQRAERNYFDPYLQTYNRLLALQSIGHPVAKVELLILGGTWSYYPESYQRWFITECLRALNEFGVRDRRKTWQQRYAHIEHTRAAHHYPVVSNDPVENDRALKSHAVHGQDLKKRYNQVVSEVYTAADKRLGLDAFQTATWDELTQEQQRNETSPQRMVGLVIETRPDNISQKEIIRLRRLGCTKTQIGFQSLSDAVLKKNHRGHNVAATKRAVSLLRRAGFKIHAHWMPNLYGSTPQADRRDFSRLFTPAFCPDELKIYPCSLIESAELMDYFADGRWRPYSTPELVELLADCLERTPEYCRLTRIIRDIPSTEIVSGNKQTNLREVAEQRVRERGNVLSDVRAREIGRSTVDIKTLQLDEVHYETADTTEIFLQWVTPRLEHAIAGFLRLSLPRRAGYISEIAHSALIREVHVYGQSLALGEQQAGKAQHLGLGTQLITQAKRVARQAGFGTLSVISAIGTRPYYRKLGFVDGELYQHITLSE